MYGTWNKSVRKKSYIPGDGLLIDVSAEQWHAGALKSRSRVPAKACGVSLAFLQRLQESLEDLDLEGKARTTSAVVRQLLSPAGLLQPSAPRSPTPPPGQPSPSPDKAQPQQQPAQQQPQQRGSESGANKGKADDPQGGATDSPQQPSSKARVLSKSMQSFAVQVPPLAKEVRTRLWDLIDPHWCGKPSYYVCYAWKGDFLEMLETVVDRVSRQPDHKEEISEGEFTVDLNAIYVWLDVLALPQQYLGSAASPEGPVFGPPQGAFDLKSVREVVHACERGVVLMIDREMAVINRAWCLFEVWLAAYYCPQDNSTYRVYAAIPTGIDVDVLLTLLNSCMSGLDLARTSSSKPEDKNQILMEVRHSAGQKRMQALTGESIVRAARGWLRWSGEPQDMAQYVALMLRSKEYAQLQYVLNAVDEIHDDEATLKEIRDLFKIYDEDGTGSLEEDEFEQVLALAGFSKEESKSIFKQVDTDGGGSVELDEFEAWWIQSQREQNRSCRPKPDLTVPALVKNLQNLAAMLKRKDCEDSAESILKLTSEFEACATGPRSPFPDGALPPCQVYGDWQSCASTLGFKITFNDLRPALRALHGLLMANVDLLPLEASPAALLPSPNSLGSDLKLQKAALAWFMALMAELLSRNPATLREADFFMKEALDLSIPEEHDAIASQHNAFDGAIAKARKGALKNDAQMESIVTDMVRVKHGKDTIISNKLVAEAYVSLSTWMAAKKGKTFKSDGSKSKEKAKSEARIQSVVEFTNSYLSMNSLADAASGPSRLLPDHHEEDSPVDAGKRPMYQRGASPPPEPQTTRSHGERAYTLGVACRAAMEYVKRGGQVEKEDSEEDSKMSVEGTSDETQEAALSTDEQSDGAELFDKFQKQEGKRRRVPLPGKQQQSKQAKGAPDLSSSKSSGSLRRASLLKNQPPSENGEEREGKADSPGESSPSNSQQQLGEERFSPRPPDPRYADGPSSDSQAQRQPRVPQGSAFAGTAQVRRSSVHMPVSSSEAQVSLASDQPVGRSAELPKMSGLPRHMTSDQDRSNIGPLPSVSPRQGSGSFSGASSTQHPSAFGLAHAHSNRSTGAHNDLVLPQLMESKPPAGWERGQSDLQARESNSKTLPQLSTKHSPSSSKPPMLDRVKDMFTRGPTASLIGSPRTHDNSSAEPQQSPPASLPTAFANSMGNNFAQRMAAAKEQPRVSMHSAQPEVTLHDLEALRHRRSLQAKASCIERHAVECTERSSSVTALDQREKGSRDFHHNIPSFFKGSPGVSDLRSHLSNKALSSPQLMLPGDATQAKSSRLREGSGGGNYKGSALSPKTARTYNEAGSSSKWLSRLSGTGLPGLTKPKPPQDPPVHEEKLDSF
uniref:EF-hand domain-containing protein n=1 Tax=Dunaliella tertiolecta TaxID=3047 RepID=A0A7S3QZ21_DUNTE|mmetsp:Transcript_17764/g.49567  ORF Transcript_17764/g.49567 Transcript_17764/m.49567 type:complete len:1359 (+) Transcript_17764:133-4209(+)